MGAANPTASMHPLAQKTLEAFHDDGLYTVVNRQGGIHIDRERLSDDQFRRYGAALGGVNDNAFTPAQQAAKDQSDRQQMEQVQNQLMLMP